MLCGDWLGCCWPWASPCVLVESSSARFWSFAGEVMIYVEAAHRVVPAIDARAQVIGGVGFRSFGMLGGVLAEGEVGCDWPGEASRWWKRGQ